MIKKICSKKEDCAHTNGPELDISEFHKHKTGKDGFHPSCKACKKVSHKKYRKANKEYLTTKAKIYRENNKEHTLVYAKEYNIKNKDKISIYHKERYQENKEEIVIRNKKYRQNNPDKCNAKRAKYRASKLQRTVPYANQAKIQAFYTEAQRLTNETGIPHHVDHIIPLQGEIISGLHVETNLQVITASDNCSKGNKFITGDYN